MNRPDMVARGRAFAAMAKADPQTFAKFLNRERKKLGLAPVGKTPPGPKPRVKEKA